MAGIEVAEISQKYGFWNTLEQAYDWIVYLAPPYVMAAVMTNTFYIFLHILQRGINRHNPLRRDVQNMQQTMELINPGLVGLVHSNSNLFNRPDQGRSFGERFITGVRRALSVYSWGLSDIIFRGIAMVVDSVTGPEWSVAWIDFPQRGILDVATDDLLESANRALLRQAQAVGGVQAYLDSLEYPVPMATRLPD